MNEATVTGLISDLNLSLEDTTRIAQEFREVTGQLARDGRWIEASILVLTQDTALYTLPANALAPLCAFYGDRQLNEEQERDLDLLGNWRDHRGEPLAYVMSYLADRTFELYPKPDVTSNAYIPIFGEPLGRDYPNYSLVLFTTFQRTVFQPWLAMLAALEISALEFRREGRQRDTQYSDACSAVADLIEEYLS